MRQKYKWFFLEIFILAITVDAQIGRTYDTSEWIPVTPISDDEPASPAEERKATGRVLNLATNPREQVSSEIEQIERKYSQPYFRELPNSKLEVRRRPTKAKTNDSPYKFENVIPLRKNHRPNQIPQSLELASQFMQPPPLPQAQYLTAPIPQANYQPQPSNSPRYYPAELSLSDQYISGIPISKEVNIPYNSSIYESLNTKTNIKGVSTTPKNHVQKETVQLLYVPLENLKPNQPLGQQSQTILQQYNEPKTRTQTGSSNNQNQYISSYHDQLELPGATDIRPNRKYQVQENGESDYSRPTLQQNIQNDFLRQALEAHKLQQQLRLGQPVLLETTTTKPKKRKPHQPPLAVYMEADQKVSLKDVLDVLKDAREISVQDSIREDSPQIFVGPSNLNPPDGYTKFPLPYLSNIDTNRIGRKVDQLPFFVAPLSYKAPPGYSKIPLPSPHVGSVVVSTREENRENLTYRPSYTKQNYIDSLNQKSVPSFDISNYQAPQSPSKVSLEYQPNPYLNQYTTLIPQISTKSNIQFNSYLEPITTEFPEIHNYNQYIKQSSHQNITPIKPKTEQYKIDEASLDQLSVFTGTPKSVLRNQINQYINSQGQSELSSATSTAKSPLEPKLKQAKPTVDVVPQIDLHQYKLYQEDEKPTAVKEPSATASSQKQNSNQQTLLRRPINQYELEQINNQFTTGNKQILGNVEYKIEEQNQPYHVEISTQTNLLETSNQTTYSHGPSTESSTPVSRKVRTRHRTTTTPKPTTTTKSNVEAERYTVLEEFSAKQEHSTTPSNIDFQSGTSSKQNTERLKGEYQPNVEYIPSNVYQIEPQQTQSRYEENNEKQNTDNNANIEHIPANVYRIEPQQAQPVYNDKIINSQTYVSSQESPKKQVSLEAPQFTQTGGSSSQSYVRQNPNESINRHEQVGKVDLPPRQQQKYFGSIPQNDEGIVFTYRQPQENYRLQASPESIGHIPENQKLPLTEDSDGDDYIIPHNLPQINPILPGLINNLQDQAVRPLLKPTLLVPTTEQGIQSTSKYDQSSLVNQFKITHIPTVSVTTSSYPSPTTTTTEAISQTTTTPYRRQRGRQRGGSRFSTTAPTRRSSRRRSQHTKATTEYENEYSSTTEHSASKTHKQEPEAARRNIVSRQRVRTRGRPPKTDNAISEHTSETLHNPNRGFKQPILQNGFKASNGEPNSYMQFDHVVDNQDIITVRASEEYTEVPTPIKDFHQVTYSLTPQSRKEEDSNENRPVVDVQISHPVTQKFKESDLITRPNGDSQYVRLNGNVQSGGVIFNNKEDDYSTTRSARIRGRGRNKIKLTSTTTTTTTTTTPRTSAPEEQSEQDEFYGFFRPPNFSKPRIQETRQQGEDINERASYLASYQTTQNPIHLHSNNFQTVQDYDTGTDSYIRPQIKFVGEIRPKYQRIAQASSTAGTAESYESETEAPRVKSRGKIRIASRKQGISRQDTVHPEQENRRYSEGSRSTESSNRKNIVRNRGKNHYRLPANLQSKDSDDEEVEGGNYPASFFKNRETTARPSGFQITVDPNFEEEEEGEGDVYRDQVPYSSINRPKIVANPDGSWVEASALVTANQIPFEGKTTTLAISDGDTNEELKSETNLTSQNEETTTESLTTISESSNETTTKKKGRRRGVWKLVKQRPVDNLEIAESQNYQSIINAFETVDKVSTKSTTATQNIDEMTTIMPSSTPENNFFDTLYDMFGNSKEVDSQTQNVETTTVKELETTTTVVPIFPNEYLEDTTTQIINIDTSNNETNPTTTTTATENIAVTTQIPVTTTEGTKNVPADVIDWDSPAVKTSTSTEISHETEICYKGKCIRSSDKKINS